MLFGFAVCSCSSDEPKYSCDPEVDKWVKEHVEEIHSMTRSEWLESDKALSVPIYRAFTPEQRINFWREKFQELKALPWSAGEIELIKDAESFFEEHLNLFGPEKNTDEQLDEVDFFFYKWCNKAKNEFSWSDDLIRLIIASGEKIQDTKGNVYKRANSVVSILSSSSERSCNCNIGSKFTCSPYVECEEKSCGGKDSGCGFLFWYACDGVCEEPI